MTLIIENDSNTNLTSFCEYLKEVIKELLNRRLNKAKLIRIDNYIEKNNILKYNKNSSKITCEEILKESLDNLITKSASKKRYTIQINPNINIEGTSTKLIDIVSLINYGNLSLNSYPIYEEVFTIVADNLIFLFEQYKGDMNGS